MHRLTQGIAVPEKGPRHSWTHVVFATLAGLALRLFFIWRFPNEFADSLVYEELARNWLDHRVYGVFLDGTLTPILIRVPGYPAFLAVVYLFLGRSLLPVMLAQIALDLGTCFLTAMLAASLVPESVHRRVFLAALWLAATCPFVAMYTAVPMTEVLATFLTTAALVLLVRNYQISDGSRGVGGHRWRVPPWFLAGLLIGLGTLVRPETPLLLVAVSLVLFLRWRLPADWPRFFRSVALMAAGLILPLLPWGARNWQTFRRVQFLAPRYYAMPGDYVPRGFYAWTNTWLVRMRDAFQVYWKPRTTPFPSKTFPRRRSILPMSVRVCRRCSSGTTPTSRSRRKLTAALGNWRASAPHATRCALTFGSPRAAPCPYGSRLMATSCLTRGTSGLRRNSGRTTRWVSLSLSSSLC